MSALDPEQQAKLDQAAKALADNVPSLIRGLYTGFISEGFTENQAMELCKIYLEAMCRGKGDLTDA